MKAKDTLTNMTISLTAIALVAAAALASVNAVTKDAIAQVQIKKIDKATSEVLPKIDGLTYHTDTIDGCAVHKAVKDGQFMGAAIEIGNDKGFGGRIQVMVGFDAEGNVSGYRILETHETPGLGAKADEWFQASGAGNIIGQEPGANPLVVKKDKGTIDAITGSTITSRAFLSAVNDAATVFNKIGK